MVEFEKKVTVKRISELKVSKDVRADNPYQGYETIFVIMDMENIIYQYALGGMVSRSLNSSSEIVTLIQPGDQVTLHYMSKRSHATDSKESLKIFKLSNLETKN